MDMPEPRFSTLPLRQMLCMGSTSEVLVRPVTAANVGIKLQKRRPSRLLRKSEKQKARPKGERRGAEGHHRPLAFNFDLTFDQLRENFSLTLQEVASKYGIAINSKACLRDALPS